MPLGPKDKVRAAHGYGYDFKHVEPQRRMPCIQGNLLVPASADDIPPITESAMQSVESALTLLADLLTDEDHMIYLGMAPRLEPYSRRVVEAKTEAKVLRRLAKALRGILRVGAVGPVGETATTPILCTHCYLTLHKLPCGDPHCACRCNREVAR